jgi:multicomponent Na+:H+ antiporter subunit A
VLYAVISGFIAAAFLPAARKLLGERSTLVAALLPLAITVWALLQFGPVTSGATLSSSIDWVASMDLALSFRMDGLALLFVLMICGIGTLVVLYTHGYLHGDPRQHKFVMYTLMFMASMVGVVLADNIILLFIFWELTSFTSYLLIGFNHHEEASRKAALQALLVTGLGGLFLLAGLLLMGQVAGTFTLSEMLTRADLITTHPHYPAILTLVLIGAFTKSAQVPFHFWLPNAMQAPTPASAYLHSSTMVKAGVYLLARLHPALGGTEAWTFWVTGIGAATLLTGALMATGQVYLKRLLAYTTVAALGGMVMLIGLGTPAAAKAVSVFILAHALYKAALFLVAGAIDHETGEKNVTKLGGLKKAMPLTAAAALIAALSMAGIPLAFGFIAKELMYAALLHPAITALAVVASACFVLVAFQVGIRPFFASRQPTPKHPHEAHWTMLLGPALLGGLTLFGGLLPSQFGDALAGSVASAILGQYADIHLYLWHGVNRELILSIITLAAGVVIIFAAAPIRHLGSRLASPAAILGPDRGYQRVLGGLLSLAKWQSKYLQSGSLRRYLQIIVITAWALFVISFNRAGFSFNFDQLTPIPIPQLALSILVVIAALAATLTNSRLGAVAAMGVVGFSVALFFIQYGAPDLAMTQLVVETLSVVLLVSAFYYLPPISVRSDRGVHVRDAILALLAGSVITVLILVAQGLQLSPPVSSYYAETSVPLAHGRNIVNVILVDYRGLDTLGEITVLAVAGIGSLALLRLRAKSKGDKT